MAFRISSARAGFLLLLVGATQLLLPGVTAKTYDVTASGDGDYDLSEAMDLAEPGDTVSLADGTYDQAIVSSRDGESGNPITVVGGRGAIINGAFNHRNVWITHSFITLEGFSVDGQIGSDADSEDSYINKCVYVEGEGANFSPLEGFVMKDLDIYRCGHECVRLINNVVGALIEDNTITDCGIHDYVFGGAKNGEGIYIGTSSSQWIDGPDPCDDNHVKGNRIETNGNECVDIKEGATGNLIEENICSNQLDDNGGCYSSQSDRNIFRYNVATNCLGAGVSVGGEEADGHQYGVDNSIYGNEFRSVGYGAIKLLLRDQGDICGNSCEGDGCDLRGGEDIVGDYIDTWDRACGGDMDAPETSSSGDAPLPPSSEDSSSSDDSSSPCKDFGGIFDDDEEGDVCCAEACGSCGADGGDCKSRGSGASECCPFKIRDKADRCSAANPAPCTL